MLNISRESHCWLTDNEGLICSIKGEKAVGCWWLTTLIPALRRQRQVDLSEFKAILVYRESSRTVRTVTQRSPNFRVCG